MSEQKEQQSLINNSTSSEGLRMAEILLQHGVTNAEQLEELLEPSYYVIIPLNILERKDLIGSAKLLYGEINALTRARGYCYATNQYIATRLGMAKSSIPGLLRKLMERNLINVDVTLENKSTHRKITPIVAQQGTPLFSNKVPPIVEQQGNKILNTKDIKIKSIQKVFLHWNTKKITIHKELRDGIRSAITTALNQYSVEEIKDSIDLYAKIFHEDRYWWSYKWGIIEFLERGLKRFDGKTAEDYLDSEYSTGGAIIIKDGVMVEVKG